MPLASSAGTLRDEQYEDSGTKGYLAAFALLEAGVLHRHIVDELVLVTVAAGVSVEIYRRD